MHGSRDRPLEEDINVYDWNKGRGYLTKRGKVQGYELGQFLRQVYLDRLPLAYDENDIYVQASDIDRCISFAYTMLAGLYPTSGDRNMKWNEELDWQPIPVHTVPAEFDRTLSHVHNIYTCAYYKQELEKQFNSDIVSQLFIDHSEEFQEIFMDDPNSIETRKRNPTESLFLVMAIKDDIRADLDAMRA